MQTNRTFLRLHNIFDIIDIDMDINAVILNSEDIWRMKHTKKNKLR